MTYIIIILNSSFIKFILIIKKKSHKYMQIKNKIYLLSNKKINFNSIISNVSKLCICIYFRLFTEH